MGGEPRLAMNVLSLPTCFGVDVAGEILAGGAEKAQEAGCAIVGGHTINGTEPLYGMCVTGMAHPDNILSNDASREGDVLVLTKEVGTGVLTTAMKGGLLGEGDVQDMFRNMCTLNKYAAEAAMGLSAHACTDITGFGLAGHLCEMSEGAHLTATLRTGKVPLFDQALKMARLGIIPAGTYRNRDFFGTRVDVASDLLRGMEDLMYDPQTSGGLLFALPAEDAHRFVARLVAQGMTVAEVGVMGPYDGASVHMLN